MGRVRTEVTGRKYATNLEEPRSGSIHQPRVGASGANPRLESNPSPTLKGLNTQTHLQSMAVSKLHFIDMVKRGFVQPFSGLPDLWVVKSEGWSQKKQTNPRLENRTASRFPVPATPVRTPMRNQPLLLADSCGNCLVYLSSLPELSRRVSWYAESNSFLADRVTCSLENLSYPTREISTSEEFDEQASAFRRPAGSNKTLAQLAGV